MAVIRRGSADRIAVSFCAACGRVWFGGGVFLVDADCQIAFLPQVPGNTSLILVAGAPSLAAPPNSGRRRTVLLTPWLICRFLPRLWGTHDCVYTRSAYNTTVNAVFVELPAFERSRARYLEDGGFQLLQAVLMANPAAGEVIEGTGGLRRAEGQENVMKKRNLFTELSEGFDALADQREGKRTLRTHSVRANPAPNVKAAEVAALRERMKLSRAVFARYLRTNVRTLENWEQGRARPNAQAALLIRLVDRYPDTVERLANI